MHEEISSSPGECEEAVVWETSIEALASKCGLSINELQTLLALFHDAGLGGDARRNALREALQRILRAAAEHCPQQGDQYPVSRNSGKRPSPPTISSFTPKSSIANQQRDTDQVPDTHRHNRDHDRADVFTFRLVCKGEGLRILRILVYVAIVFGLVWVVLGCRSVPAVAFPDMAPANLASFDGMAPLSRDKGPALPLIMLACYSYRLNAFDCWPSKVRAPHPWMGLRVPILSLSCGVQEQIGGA